jgi:crotonobetainyl-CoA:carnitine CoA-transferase CaiB-like acyl-CoA transferase
LSDQPALDGVRVVDASSYLTGPWAAMMLADLGADVIKVEPPRGDPFRRFGRRHNGLGISFANANRNKRSVAVDLRDPAGRSTFDRLVAEADVLITNWRPETTRAIGLDDGLVEANPRLVWIRISGFGPEGPQADAPAFDSVIQARTGLAWVEGDGMAPSLVRSWVCDKATAMFAAQMAMAGLLRRGRTGRGGVTDLPMLDAMAYFNFPEMMVERTLLEDADNDGDAEGEADGNALNRHIAANRPIATSDGWILVSPVVGRHIAGALRALGQEDRKPDLLAITEPTALTAAFCEIAEEATKTKSTAHWLGVLRDHGVPAAPVLDIDGHLSDEQVAHNRVYRSLDHPVLGPVRAPHHPGAPTGEIRPSPSLGEDSADSVTW